MLDVIVPLLFNDEQSGTSFFATVFKVREQLGKVVFHYGVVDQSADLRKLGDQVFSLCEVESCCTARVHQFHRLEVICAPEMEDTICD